MTRRAALVGAVACSALGVALSVTAAIERTAPGPERALLIALSVLVTLAAHGLLVIVRGPAAWLAWSACIALVSYGHVTALSAVVHHAGQARAAETRVPAAAEAAALQQQLDALSASPTTAAAAALASARAAAARADRAVSVCEQRDPGRCASARAAASAASAKVDSAEAGLVASQRADALRERLAALAAQADASRARAAIDPAALVVERLTGLDSVTTQSAVSAASALVIELIAVLLWSAAYPRAPHADTSTPAVPDPRDRPARRAGGPALRIAAAAGRAPAARDADRPDCPRPAPRDGLHRPRSHRRTSGRPPGRRIPRRGDASRRDGGDLRHGPDPDP